MCDQTTVVYNHGDIVWVKLLNTCWWPGEVIGFDQLPSDVQSSFKKPPLASVKFFEEDNFEFVKSLSQIFTYNCSKKYDFIRKGLDMHRNKHSFMEKFPTDVCTAETKTGGNPNILNDPKLTPQKKANYADIFGTPNTKKSGKDTPKSAGRKSAGKVQPATSAKKSTSIITHPRFIGRDDHVVRELIQSSAKQPQPKKTEYKCQSCSFKCTRVDVIVLHNKSHIQGVYTTGPTGKPKRSPVKRPKPGSQMSRTKTNTIDEDIALLMKGIPICTDESSDDAEPIEVTPKRKQKATSTTKPKKAKVSKSPVPEPTPKDIRTDLLAEWDDDDDEEEETEMKTASMETDSTEAKIEEKFEDKSEKPKPEKDNSCFDFNEEDDDLGTSVEGRKIPRVIPPTEKRKSQEFAYLPKTKEFEDKKSKYKSALSEKATQEEKEMKNDSSTKETDFEAFKSILEETKLPKLPEVPQILKCEQNFHNAKTIKFPDKAESLPEAKESPIATKLTNPKKRFVKTFEDETKNSTKEKEEKIAEEQQPIEEKKDEKVERENDILDKIEVNQQDDEEMKIPVAVIEVIKTDAVVIEEKIEKRKRGREINLEVSKLKSQLMMKLNDPPKGKDKYKKETRKKRLSLKDSDDESDSRGCLSIHEKKRRKTSETQDKPNKCEKQTTKSDDTSSTDVTSNESDFGGTELTENEKIAIQDIIGVTTLQDISHEDSEPSPSKVAPKTVDENKTVLIPESDIVDIDGNLTVVSEKDLADKQVEITTVPEIQKPITLTSFSMDFSEELPVSDTKKRIDILMDTEFHKKYLTPEKSPKKSEISKKIGSPKGTEFSKKIDSPKKTEIPIRIESSKTDSNKIESSNKIDSPKKGDSPKKVDSPKKPETSKKVDSFNTPEDNLKPFGSPKKSESPKLVDSPKKSETPKKVDSFNKPEDNLKPFDSPKKPESSKIVDSPKKPETPKKVDSFNKPEDNLKPFDSPKKPESSKIVDSPQKPETPKKIDSFNKPEDNLKQFDSPKKPESPKIVDSPKKPETPKKVDSFNKPEDNLKQFDSPTKPESPKIVDSPKKPETPKKVDSFNKPEDNLKQFDSPKKPESPKIVDSPKKPETAKKVDSFNKPQDNLKQFDSPKKPETPKQFDSPKKPETLNQFDSPKKSESLKEIASPKKAESLKEIDSPKKAESPNRIESPKKSESPTKMDSPKKPESPKKMESPIQNESPKKNDDYVEEKIEAEDECVKLDVCDAMDEKKIEEMLESSIENNELEIYESNIIKMIDSEMEIEKITDSKAEIETMIEKTDDYKMDVVKIDYPVETEKLDDSETPTEKIDDSNIEIPKIEDSAKDKIVSQIETDFQEILVPQEEIIAEIEEHVVTEDTVEVIKEIIPPKTDETVEYFPVPFQKAHIEETTVTDQFDFGELVEEETPEPILKKTTPFPKHQSLESEVAKITDSICEPVVIPQQNHPTTSTKLLEILTDKPKHQKALPKLETPKDKKPSRSVKSLSQTVKPKPVIIPEQPVKPESEIQVKKVTAKRSFNDIEDIDTFIIQKPVKKLATENPEIPESVSKPVIKPVAKGKARILQQTIITPSGDIIQPAVTQSQDDLYDINSMPIMLGDQLLTDSIEPPPVVVKQEPLKQINPIKKLPTTPAPTPPMKILNKGVAMKDTKLSAVAAKAYLGGKQKIQKVYQTSSTTKLLKSNPSIITQPGKPGKFIIVPSTTTPPTGSKYTVGKRPTIVKKTPQKMPISSVSPKVQEPTGNKIMILTDSQGQQQKVLLTPAQQKQLIGQKKRPIFQKQIVTKDMQSRGANILSQTIVSSKGQVTTMANPMTTTSKNVKIDPKSKRPLQRMISEPIIKPGPSGQQRTIIIKNQHGQTVKKIQGTDDTLLEQQVAEQVQAINRAAKSQMKETLRPPLRTPPTKKSYIKKDVRVPVKQQVVQNVPPLAPISPSKKPEPVVETKPEEPQDDKPKFVIRDGNGALISISEGQILALPSEAVDGQPQSYVLVTVDESGNLTPLNSEALMSLDPNLNLGGDLSNTLLQIEQGAQQEGEMQLQIVADAPAVEEAPPVVEKEVEKPIEQEVCIPTSSEHNVQAVVNAGDMGQLIITGDPVSAQKFLDSLAEGNTDLANLLANTDGNVLIQTDGQQILINTDAENSMMLVNQDGVGNIENSEGSGNPVFAVQSSSKSQDILAAALADTDVFQQDQAIKGVPQLSPNSGLFPIVGNVLETNTMNSPIMTPLEIPSTNTKKIDETDILNQGKNDVLPITITDPSISQTASQHQVASLMAGDLQDLPLTIQDPGMLVASSGMNSPSFVYSLPTLDDSDISQKTFSGSISMPLLTEEPEEIPSSIAGTDKDSLAKEGEINTTDSTEIPKEEAESDTKTEEEYMMRSEICNSLSEPPPDMFEFTIDSQQQTPEIDSTPSSVMSNPINDQESMDMDRPICSDSSMEDALKLEDTKSSDVPLFAVNTSSPSTEDSCEIPVQPPIITSLAKSFEENGTSDEQSFSTDGDN